MNDARIQRERQASADALLDRSDAPPGDCNAAVLLTLTTVTSYPTSAGVYYGGNPTDVGAPEVEGGAASYMAGTSIQYALNLGSQIPPAGTRVVAHSVGGRLVFRYDG